MDCKPGSASLPFFGVEPAILDEHGKDRVSVGLRVLNLGLIWGLGFEGGLRV